MIEKGRKMCCLQFLMNRFYWNAIGTPAAFKVNISRKNPATKDSEEEWKTTRERGISCVKMKNFTGRTRRIRSTRAKHS